MDKEMTKERKRTDIKSLTFTAMMAALCCIIGPLSIPLGEVPVSLQVLAVYLCVFALGMKLGTISVGLYLLLGFLGLPVFAGYSGGIQSLLGPTGGYIVGFAFTAFVMGFVMEHIRVENKAAKVAVQILAMVCGLAVCYLFGTLWFMYVMKMGLVESLTLCVMPFLLFDAIKMVMAVIMGNALRAALSKANLMHY